jgi:hypothetical protein
MHAITVLQQQHVKAKAAFQEIEGAPVSERGALWRALRPELEQHEQIEEAHVYGPAAREAQGDRTLAAWERTHQEQVEEAERLIREIDRLDPSDRMWLTAVQQLRSTLEQHIQREEHDIWPRIERAWGAARLEEVGRRLEQAA